MKTRTILLLSAVLAGGLASQPGSTMTFLVNGGLPILLPPTKSFSLGRQIAEGVGTFEDLYEFTLESPITMMSSGFQSTRLGDASNLDFTNAMLYDGLGTSGAVIASYIHGNEDASGQETESLGATLLGPGSYTILVRGNVTADTPIYNGNVTFAAAAVPEPAAWGLMVLGFGAIGAALRSQRRKVTFA